MCRLILINLIAQNLERLHKHLRDLGKEGTRIVAVTKKQKASSIQSLLSLGHVDIGENRLAEFRTKYEELESGYTSSLQPIFHYLAPVQSGNARHLVRYFSCFHGVSSLSGLNSLLQNAEKQYDAQNSNLNLSKTGPALRLLKKEWPLKYFIQIRLTDEAQKSGMRAEEFCALDSYPESPYLQCAGLMTMGPQSKDPVETREVFEKLRELRDLHAPGKLLSMGMSSDWQIAVQEGSDILRLGQELFRTQSAYV